MLLPSPEDPVSHEEIKIDFKECQPRLRLLKLATRLFPLSVKELTELTVGELGKKLSSWRNQTPPQGRHFLDLMVGLFNQYSKDLKKDSFLVSSRKFQGTKPISQSLLWKLLREFKEAQPRLLKGRWVRGIRALQRKVLFSRIYQLLKSLPPVPKIPERSSNFKPVQVRRIYKEPEEPHGWEHRPVLDLSFLD